MPQNLTRRSTLSIALAFGLLAAPVAHADAPESLPGATTVNAEGVIELITNTPNLVILDNRRQGDYTAGHIEGAVNLIDTDITGADVLVAHGVNADTPVLFYCNGLSCPRSSNATKKAVDWGYTNVYYYAHGMTEWNSLGLPLVSR